MEGSEEGACLKNHGPICRPVELACASLNGGRLSGSRGSIKEQMREAVFGDESLDCIVEHLANKQSSILVAMISVWETRSSKRAGRYFSTLKIMSACHVVSHQGRFKSLVRCATRSTSIPTAPSSIPAILRKPVNNGALCLSVLSLIFALLLRHHGEHRAQRRWKGDHLFPL